MARLLLAFLPEPEDYCSDPVDFDDGSRRPEVLEENLERTLIFPLFSCKLAITLRERP
jgi:hypothetical protein